MNGDFNNITYKDALDSCVEILELKFGENAKSKAMELISQINSVALLDFKINYLTKNISKSKLDYLTSCAKKRAQNMPIQYITKKAFFYEDEFEVGEGVLIPRFDTENLVNEAISKSIEIMNLNTQVKEIEYIEFCAGSGCISISFAKKLESLGKKSKGIATDISDTAICFAKMNKNKIYPKGDISFIKHDLLNDEINFETQTVDIIIANPPYIKSDIISTLDSEVKDYEPILALDGGEDGLMFYRKIVQISLKLLNPGGYLLLEIGYDQQRQVKSIIRNSDSFDQIDVKQDLGKNTRVVVAKKTR